MKRVLAIVLVLVLALSLFACANNSSTTSPSAAASSAAASSTDPSSAASSAAPSASAAASASGGTAASPSAGGKVEVGFFDPSVDYSKAKQYKVAYLYSGTSVLYDMFSKAFEAWAKRMNCKYNVFSTTDTDAFVTTIQTYADQGYNGLLLDPDSTIYERCADVVNEAKMPWMGCMSSPLDANGKLIHPAVGFDNYGFGFDMFNWCIDYAKKTWKDATPANTGGMFIGYSVVPLLEQRHKGAHDAFVKAGYTEKNFYFLDGVAAGGANPMTAQVGYDLSSATMSAHPEIKYWIACGFFDDYSDGIAPRGGCGRQDQPGCVLHSRRLGPHQPLGCR